MTYAPTPVGAKYISEGISCYLTYSTVCDPSRRHLAQGVGGRDPNLFSSPWQHGDNFWPSLPRCTPKFCLAGPADSEISRRIWFLRSHNPSKDVVQVVCTFTRKRLYQISRSTDQLTCVVKLCLALAHMFTCKHTNTANKHIRVRPRAAKLALGLSVPKH